ncbi:MAG: hypothetical protein AAGA10_30930 [Bacteroidota bacterium]
MSYTVILFEDAEQEIEEEAYAYSLKFTSGAEDFLNAVLETLDHISVYPHTGKRRSSIDEGVRGFQVKIRSSRKQYAKRFPFELIFKVFEAKKEVVVFQLWPVRSNLPINNPPN